MNWRKPVIFSLLRLRGSHIPVYLEQMRRCESFSREGLETLRTDKLTCMLQHAYENVPYYHRILGEYDVVVDGRVRLENFTRLPLLTKDIMRREGTNLHAKDNDRRRTYPNTSGGSTGEPVEFVQDQRYDDWNNATKLYFNLVLGKAPGEPEIKFWGSDRDILAGNLAWKDRLINVLYNRRFFNSYRLGEQELQSLVDLNNRFRPAAYWSYMESALELARYLARRPQDFHSPRFVISTIGPLTEEVRSTIESQMRCPVYNQYGSREVGAIACQCKERKGLHAFPWWNHLEIVDDADQPLERGEGRVVVTTLENFSMPLIRYEIGDVAVAGGHGCPCGRQTFQIESVMGRTLGYFKKPDGSLAHSHFLVQALFFRDWVKRFQVVQDELDHVLIRVELAGREAPQEDLEDVTRKTKVLMGSSCRVDFAFVDEIERSASGKYVYTLCKI
jgi:phenylacetate-CoA ligase